VTLDSKSSRLRFPPDTKTIITDAVGFIRDLIAAFGATFDKLHEADVLLHVIDVSNPNFESHIRAVAKILEELDISGNSTIRVFNKEDRFSDKAMLQNLCQRFGAITITALIPKSSPLLLKRWKRWSIKPGQG
jgi:GTP-binding protein HflX